LPHQSFFFLSRAMGTPIHSGKTSLLYEVLGHLSATLSSQSYRMPHNHSPFSLAVNLVSFFPSNSSGILNLSSTVFLLILPSSGFFYPLFSGLNFLVPLPLSLRLIKMASPLYGRPLPTSLRYPTQPPLFSRAPRSR